jgi:aspartate/methionine/tyrosine aminotransferase
MGSFASNHTKKETPMKVKQKARKTATPSRKKVFSEEERSAMVSRVREAKGEGVAFVAGPDFMIEGGENSLRLSFASVPPERIPEGIARIARALERVRAASPA